MRPRSIYLFLLASLMSGVLFYSSCKEKKPVEMPPPKVPVVEVIKKTIPVDQEFVGQIYGISDIPIRARVEGWLEGIHFDEGGRVSRGKLLYTIDEEPFRAKVAEAMSRVAEARTLLTNAESDLNRIRPLAEINAVSQSDLDAAQAAYDAAQANLDAANANLEYAQIQLGYTRVTSPIDGIIGKTQARVGEFVGRSPNPVILNTVSRIDTVRVEFFLTESDYLVLTRNMLDSKQELAKVQENTKERKPNLELILADGSVHKYLGSVDFVDREVDPGTGALLIQASFPNPEKILRPGQFARVKVKIRDIEDALVLPQRCLIELQGTFSVLLVTDEGLVEQKQVQVGPVWKDYRVIRSGLQSGDKIILEGLQKVRTGMKVSPDITVYESRFEN